MSSPLYNQVLGTGGIGTGILFELDSNRTLSRNETRLAALSPTKDYCKQHIILHYIARILAPEAAVLPIGMVGEDAAGEGLLAQMREVGMDVRFVGKSATHPTMYCVCMQYPDKSVCNVTTSKSACALVNRDYIVRAIERLPARMDERTLVVAVPEVPMEARLELLKQARDAGAYCVSSCLVDEFEAFFEGHGVQNTDLLVINEDEAAACCGVAEVADMHILAINCYARLRSMNPDICLAMTCGAAGSWICASGVERMVPAYPTEVAATGGAGDAYTAGLICGLAMRLPILPGREPSAPELGAWLATEAVRDPDTIAGSIGKSTVNEFLKRRAQAQ